MKYQFPKDVEFPIHHPRPRFKNQVEDVLIYMAQEICRIGKAPVKTFDQRLRDAIYRFPGNANLKLKTVDNWRTEIDALFGLISRTGSTAEPTKLCVNLAASGDLISFFLTSMAKFQYPGGHVTPSENIRLIENGVQFKPAQFIVRVLLSGQSLSNNPGSLFGISKQEAASLIWNDIRVTTGNRSAEEVASAILSNRDLKADYKIDGDYIRYAGDILDYLTLANVLKLDLVRKRYFLIPGSQDAANLILSNTEFFNGYASFYGKVNLQPSEIREIEPEWVNWAGNQVDGLVQETDTLAVLEEIANSPFDSEVDSAAAQALLSYLREMMSSADSIGTKDIGNTGESIVQFHESNRLAKLGAEHLSRKIKKIPDHLGVGYDIKSFMDANEANKLIEVKSTISRGNLTARSFHLTRSEWAAAESSGEAYYVYRVLISANSLRCFVIHNPVRKYKDDLLEISLNSGVDVTYTEIAGYWEELLFTA